MATNLLDVFGLGGGAIQGGSGSSGQMFIPQMSNSCPSEMKDEKMRGGCPPFGMNPSKYLLYVLNYSQSMLYLFHFSSKH